MADAKAELADAQRRIAALEARVAELSAAATPPLAIRTCALEAAELRQYGRQMILPAFGSHSQEALRRMRVLVIGAGGLGCPSAMYLAAAGVGALGIVDDDTVDVSNLHRQIGHTTAAATAGTPKAESLAATLRSLNPGVDMTAHVCRFSAHTAEALVSRYHVVVDASDNPGTRYLVNDACVLLGRPLVSGAAVATDGQLSVYGYAGGPCYRCLHPHPPPPGGTASCSDAGVLGPITGVIGSLQALEVLKLASDLACGRWTLPVVAGAELCDGTALSAPPVPAASVVDGAGAVAAATASVAARGVDFDGAGAVSPMGESMSQRLLVFDGADTRFRVVKLRPKDPACAVCGAAPSITSAASSAAWLAARGVATMEGPALAPPLPAAVTGSAGSVDAAAGGGGSRDEDCGCPVEATAVSLTDSVPHVSPRAAAAALSAAAPVATAGACSSAIAARSACARPAVLVDVRSPTQHRIVSLQPCTSLPLATIEGDAAAAADSIRAAAAAAVAAAPVTSASGVAGVDVTAEGGAPSTSTVSDPLVLVICRRGVDSIPATMALRRAGLDAYNVAGGLDAYRAQVDGAFPAY